MQAGGYIISNQSAVAIMIQIYHALRPCLSIVKPNLVFTHKIDMGKKPIFTNRRVADPYVDRRSGEDRRKVYSSDYWDNWGIERRTLKERRLPKERRSSFARVSKWSSVCTYDNNTL